MISDASIPTFLLTHWARDRSRGDRIPIEELVENQTSRTAKCYGLHDRGVVAPGMKADLNVIDYANLHIHAPKIVYDLPASGKRFVQEITGYRNTICSGEVIYRNIDGNAERHPEVGVVPLDIPCLMLMADRDPALRPEFADDMPERCSNLEMHLIEKAGHWVQQEQSEAFNRHLLGWLQRHFAVTG